MKHVTSTLDGQPSGTLTSLVTKCFEGFAACDPESAQEWVRGWIDFDKEIYEKPEVASCGFYTLVDGVPVGMVSWCPAETAGTWNLGLNGVLPEYRHRGLGRSQVDKALKILREKGARIVRVSTGEHVFFEPAQRMYEACGFKRVGRDEGAGKPFPILEYHIVLTG